MTFNYQRYLASREWALLKEQVRERSYGRCENCFVAPYQETNHLTYERIGHEDLADIIAVCRPCHEWYSGKRDDNPRLNTVLLSVRAVDNLGPFHLALNIGQTETMRPLMAEKKGHAYRFECTDPCRFCNEELLTVTRLLFKAADLHGWQPL